MNNLLIFLDELYFKKNQQYVSKFNAGRFLLKLSNTCVLKFMFPVGKEMPINATTIIGETEVIPLSGWNSLLSYLKQFSKINKQIKMNTKKLLQEIDIVWIRMPSLPGLYLATIALKKKIPCIFHFAGDVRYGYQNEQYKRLQKLMAFFSGYIIHYAFKVITKHYSDLIYNLSTGTKLLKEFDIKNSKYFIDSETSPSIRVLKNNEILKFVFVGKLTKSKGILVLLNVLKNIKNVQVDIIGYGPLKRHVQDFCLENVSCHFWGFKTASELDEMYSTSDVLIMPSINNSEGFPRVIVEAWSNGLAVISTDVGGIKGIGQHEKNILFVKPNEIRELGVAINRLVNDRALLKKLKRNGFETSKKLSHSAMLSVAIETINIMTNT